MNYRDSATSNDEIFATLERGIELVTVGKPQEKIFGWLAGKGNR